MSSKSVLFIEPLSTGLGYNVKYSPEDKMTAILESCI